MRELIGSIEHEYRRYKGCAQGTFDQVSEDQLVHVPAADGNSVAILVWHVAGNLRSRFTDFLTTDGQKPWSQRDSEFEGLIFRTQEELGEAVWVVAALDRARHEVEYHRVEPGRYVTAVRVRCRDRGVQESEVEVHYTLVGLSDAGNREIAAMSQATFAQKMTRWRGWMAGCLERGGQ